MIYLPGILTMKTLLIVNPAAGHGRGKKCFKRLEPRLGDAIPGLIVRISEYPGHAVELGRRAGEEGFERLILLGGDGTPFEVVNGLYAGGRPETRPEIGLIPAGTGNSFVRDFGILSADQALDNILAGRRHLVDLIEFEHEFGFGTARRYALNILGVGLIADILQLTNERLKFLGAAGYSLAVLLRLAKGMANRIEIETDGRARTVADSALVVSNSKYTGGNMMIAPGADLSDGRADLVLFNRVNRREIVAIFRGVFSGRHTAHPKVEVLQAARISVAGTPSLRVMADGELLGMTPLRLRVLRGELTILV
jgi:diacylglycerol kinase (ATP)